MRIIKTPHIASDRKREVTDSGQDRCALRLLYESERLRHRVKGHEQCADHDVHSKQDRLHSRYEG